MHLLSPTGPVTTCTGEAVETATERGADASANVMAVDCIPCLRQALVETFRERDALAAEVARMRQAMANALAAIQGGR